MAGFLPFIFALKRDHGRVFAIVRARWALIDVSAICPSPSIVSVRIVSAYDFYLPNTWVVRAPAVQFGVNVRMTVSNIEQFIASSDSRFAVRAIHLQVTGGIGSAKV